MAEADDDIMRVSVFFCCVQLIKVSKNTVAGRTNTNTTECWLIQTGFVVPSISFLLALHQVTQNTSVIKEMSHCIASFQCPSQICVCVGVRALYWHCVGVCASNLMSIHVVFVCVCVYVRACDPVNVFHYALYE